MTEHEGSVAHAQPKMDLLELLKEMLNHDSGSCTFQLFHIEGRRCLFCEVCEHELVKWKDQHKGIFTVKIGDMRGNRNQPVHNAHFELYRENVVARDRDCLSVRDARDRMKANLRNCCNPPKDKRGKAAEPRLIFINKTNDENTYQFVGRTPLQNFPEREGASLHNFNVNLGNSNMGMMFPDHAHTSYDASLAQEQASNDYASNFEITENESFVTHTNYNQEHQPFQHPNRPHGQPQPMLMYDNFNEEGYAVMPVIQSNVVPVATQNSVNYLENSSTLVETASDESMGDQSSTGEFNATMTGDFSSIGNELLRTSSEDLANLLEKIDERTLFHFENEDQSLSVGTVNTEASMEATPSSTIGFPPSQSATAPAPRANYQKFSHFVTDMEEAGRLDLRRGLSEIIRGSGDILGKIKRKSVHDSIKDMTIRVFARLTEDQAMKEYVINNVFEKSHPGGFRLLRKAEALEHVEMYQDVQRFGPTQVENCSLKDVDIWTTDLKNQINHLKLFKCLETFEKSGIVFVWKRYEPPDNLERAVGNRDIAAMLCWRLYCYRICKGYQSRNEEERERMDQEKKLKSLEICLKPAGKESGKKLEVHNFVLVFDLLQQLLQVLEARREINSNQWSEVASREKLRQCIQMGLYSSTRWASHSLPMRIQINHDLIEELLSDKITNGTEDDSSSHFSRSTVDSNL